MDAFVSALTTLKAPVEQPPKPEIDRKKLEARIAECEAQIIQQTKEMNIIFQKASEQQAGVQAWIESEVQKAADEKRNQLVAEWDGAVNQAIAPLETGIALCQDTIQMNRELLEGKE